MLVILFLPDDHATPLVALDLGELAALGERDGIEAEGDEDGIQGQGAGVRRFYHIQDQPHRFSGKKVA
jgi:hypothetical protein